MEEQKEDSLLYYKTKMQKDIDSSQLIINEHTWFLPSLMSLRSNKK